MEFFKDCCKNFSQRNKQEPETQVIKIKAPPKEIMLIGELPDERTRIEKTEDYLISKQPPGGREVPFVVPTFKPTYVQPQSHQFSALQPGLHSSARSTYAGRKAELLGASFFPYNSESIFHQGSMPAYISPGAARRDAPKSGPRSPGWTVKPGNQRRLSSSMLDLSSPQSHSQRIDSTSSTVSSASSMMSSMESSLESIALSVDEQELGKVCVRVRYQQDVEQVWITLVQCSDLVVHPDEVQKVGFKAILTVPKPIQFKTTLKEYQQNVAFMETFVFTLRLQQLQSSALVLRLQTHSPRKRTAAEAVLSLRQLSPQESEHWLDLQQPSKSSASHSELHLSTLFQPVSGRIQVKVLAAQNLPPSSSPLSQVFFVKAEMHQLGQLEIKKKTRALKASGGQCRWEETFHFLLASLEHACSLSLRLYSRSSVRRKQCLGQVQLGFDSPLPEAVEQWKDTMAHPEKAVTAWHRLSPP
ncbi:tandem C2 domains nuclear protein [Poeciliopsis prolifica]|uniref:tandem C2 domains nuclear protein n=1 Tax=Poeciliopsis prolifica TaxID=188132 RepID=UPI002413FC3E|nr:tandem C2 domains nuclear protein [Poeciliopsis prolifica]XP_054913382.1 tandem C2 domains nuclear protein [Poeciliopsis prolifica]